MAEFRIFYAWQSDRPAKLCRSLIRSALDDAKKQIQGDLAIDDAPDIEIDQDTQGSPGSPPVAETILQKIRESDVFVADLTFSGKRVGRQESPVPNSNVLIEYGYALHALGHERIVAVFNEEFGDCKDLPFDVSHRRWPNTYRTSGAGSDERAQAACRAERKELARKLAYAIKTIVQEEAKRREVTDDANAGPLIGRFPLDGELVRQGTGKRYRFPDGAKILLRLRSARGNLSLTNVDALRVAQDSLKPLAWKRSDGWSPARFANGAAVAVLLPDDELDVLTASILERNGNLYGIDCYHVGRHEHAGINDPFVPISAVEEILRDGLHQFLEVAEKHLNLALPLDVEVALEGIKGYRLAVDQAKFVHGIQGPFLVDRIEDRFRIDDYDADPAGVLKPFFEDIYDAAGLERP